MEGSKDGNVVINYPETGSGEGFVSIQNSSLEPFPLLPATASISSAITYVKQAPKDTIVFDESTLSAEMLLELYFEDIGALELATLSRSSSVDGQQVSYSPIKNLSSLKRRYSPSNIISSSASLSTYFSRFGIDLLKRGIYFPFADSNGDIVIKIDSVLDDEDIEVQIISSGTIERVEE